MNIVISQSTLFPQVGMLEQIVSADAFVNYADVQFSRGSFINRIQIKDRTGSRWPTVPLEKFHLGERIDQIRPCISTDWRGRHLRKLEQACEEAPYAQDVLALVCMVYEADYVYTGALALVSMQVIYSYLNIPLSAKLRDSVGLTVPGRDNDHVLVIVRQLHDSKYIIGYGARNYLAHVESEQHGITVEYMNYAMLPYRQLHGAFTSFVSSLDLIANHGPTSKQYLNSQTLNWRRFTHE